MSAEVRRRVVLGIGIPLVAFLFLAALIFAFSRILLAVPEELAPWIALLFATNILVGCALAADIRGTRGFAFLITILVGTIVFGGVAGAVIGERPVHSLIEEEHAGGEAPASPEAPPTGQASPQPPEESPPGEAGGGGGGGGGGEQSGAAESLTASNLAFDRDQLTFVGATASGEVTISFDNQDSGVPHNVSIYQGDQAVFEGEIITGPDSIDYTFPAPPPGEYEFRCDVHPTTMVGTASVA